MSGNSIFASGFFADGGFDFETRIALGHAPYGAADAGEVLATIAAIRDGDDTSWVAAWTALGDRLAQAAQDCDAAGHRVSAASAWLRAAVA
ncbi:MAG: dipeptidyl aminopeptidase, partial [Burkholderiales bacterium]|nr:dipeptidyl aminopeptidase [Burkholderiales bacterium]